MPEPTHATALISKYRQYLPVTDTTPIITLREGFTPLIEAKNLPGALSHPQLKLYFKLEGLNPTGSFKDRGMTLAISKALEEGARAVICASTGNTSASAAAYAAKAGLACYVILPAGHVALGKLAQAILYGATIVPIEGNFDHALALVRTMSAEFNLTVVNSINPYRLEGQKTAAFEVIEMLGGAPDYLFIPVGNAGNICAYWRGFKQWREQKRVDKTPRMCGFEAEGAAAIVAGKPFPNPETVATAIRIGNPASWEEAVQAARESDGEIDSVTDEEILSAYQSIARCEGIFCEPASAASLAGFIKHLKLGKVDPDKTAVCVLTGNGLKDPDSAIKVGAISLTPVAAEPERLREAMKL
jgi:threonine synthase